MDFLAPGRAGFTDEVTHDGAFGAFDSKDPTMDDRMGGFTGSAKAIGQEQGFHKRQKPKKVEKKGDDDDDVDLKIANKLEKEITKQYEEAIKKHIDPNISEKYTMAFGVDDIKQIVKSHLDAISEPMQSLKLGTYLDSINKLLPGTKEIELGVGVYTKENVHNLFTEIITKIEQYKDIEKKKSDKLEKNNKTLKTQIAKLQKQVESLQKKEKSTTDQPASTTEKNQNKGKSTTGQTTSTTEKKMKPAIEFNRELLASNLKGLSIEKLRTRTGKTAFRFMIALLFGKNGEYMNTKQGLEVNLTDEKNKEMIGDDMVEEKDQILVHDDKISIGEAAHFALNYKSALFSTKPGNEPEFRLRDLIARMLQEKSKNEGNWQNIINELEKRKISTMGFRSIYEARKFP